MNNTARVIQSWPFLAFLPGGVVAGTTATQRHDFRDITQNQASLMDKMLYIDPKNPKP